MTLAKWNYTKEEWRTFRVWKNRTRGFPYSLFYWVALLLGFSVPEIRIAPDRVWFNDRHEPFLNSRCRFMEVNIRETGNLDVLEISYEQGSRNKLISVPIPKGKLPEAIAIQESLVFNCESIG
jgi:hypothetical protein